MAHFQLFEKKLGLRNLKVNGGLVGSKIFGLELFELSSSNLLVFASFWFFLTLNYNFGFYFAFKINYLSGFFIDWINSLMALNYSVAD